MAIRRDWSVVLPLRDEVSRLHGVYRSDRLARLLCWCIFGVAAGLAVASVSIAAVRAMSGMDLTTVFSLRREGGVSETYEYLLSGAVVAMSIWTFWKTRMRSFVFVSVLFAFILLDGSLQYHERMGEALAGLLPMLPIGNLRVSDEGEMVSWALAGIAMLPVLLWCLRGLSRADVGVYLVYSGLLAGLVLFAVGVDFLHAAVRGLNADGPVGQIEDGGELFMLAASAAVALLYLRGSAEQPSP